MKKTCLSCGEPNTSANDYFCSDCVSESEWIKANPTLLRDSGARREFESGAVRDISDGKGRCDLLPLSVVADLLQLPELHHIEDFKRTKDPGCLYKAIRIVCKRNFDAGDAIDDIELLTLATLTGILEVSKHYEDGARKYSENNWMKGLPIHCFIDSGVRHLLKHLRGDKDEPHDRAFVWNMLGAVWTLTNKPELWDLMQGLDGED